MAKTKRKWIVLNYNDPDALRAVDIPYNATTNVKEAIDNKGGGGGDLSGTGNNNSVALWTGSSSLANTSDATEQINFQSFNGLNFYVNNGLQLSGTGGNLHLADMTSFFYTGSNQIFMTLTGSSAQFFLQSTDQFVITKLFDASNNGGNEGIHLRCYRDDDIGGGLNDIQLKNRDSNVGIVINSPATVNLGSDSSNVNISSGADTTLTAYGGSINLNVNNTHKLFMLGISTYADNSAAITGGLSAGCVYRDSSNPSHLCIVY
jgi:hypothetical protein